MTSPTQRTYQCSFCGKSDKQARRLIAGPHGVYICDECVQLCNEILEKEKQGPPKPPSSPTTP